MWENATMQNNFLFEKTLKKRSQHTLVILNENRKPDLQGPLYTHTEDVWFGKQKEKKCSKISEKRSTFYLFLSIRSEPE